jgi:uncharacterized protein
MPTSQEPLRPFSLLVKPASADCNLRCEYCFYLEKSALYPDSVRHRMTDEVLERMIRSYMETEQPTYSIGWQGGEPTIMGIDFFRKVVGFQKQFGKTGAVVSNGLQTNATLIDDEFAALLGEYKFLVGVSVDGPEEIHNTYRLDLGGSGSHEKVMRGIEALKRNNVEHNALVLVSTANVQHAAKVYTYLKEMGFYFHQYIPCVEFDDAGKPLPFTITGEQWGDFLIELFDIWKERDVRRVSVRDFDAIVGHMVTGQYSMCVQAGKCTSYFVVEHNGDVYPCDFFVERSKKLGSVMRDSWPSMQQSNRYEKFGSQKSAWHAQCTECSHLRYCSGDCLKQRFYGNSSDPSNLSWLCRGWKRFYDHAVPFLERTSVELLNERSQQMQQQRPQHHTRIYDPKTGWNDVCYCGSGRKYRLCHGMSISRAGSISRK